MVLDATRKVEHAKSILLQLDFVVIGSASGGPDRLRLPLFILPGNRINDFNAEFAQIFRQLSKHDHKRKLLA